MESRHGRMTPLFRRAAALAAVTALMTSALVLAAEAPSRAEYVKRLEAICKPDVEATERAMKGVRDDVRAERLGVAAGKFATGSRIFAGTVRKMQGVPRPTADTAKLKKWFDLLGQEKVWLRRITESLRAHRAIQAQRETA